MKWVDKLILIWFPLKEEIIHLDLSKEKIYDVLMSEIDVVNIFRLEFSSKYFEGNIEYCYFNLFITINKIRKYRNIKITGNFDNNKISYKIKMSFLSYLFCFLTLFIFIIILYVAIFFNWLVFFWLIPIVIAHYIHMMVFNYDANNVIEKLLKIFEIK